MNYDEWNTAIARHFFKVGMGGKEVLLFVNEEKINALGSSKEATVKDFIEALKKDAESMDNILCKRALKLYKNWRQNNSEYPPYIAFLALFVLASTTEGEFDEKAYYPRYWKLIGTPGEGAPAYFYETAELWDDLEKWSIEDKREELGRFKAKIRGNWRYVGRPLSQTLLSDDERDALPEIFYDCGFDPSNIPSGDIIKSGMIRHGSKRLRRRTLTLLRSQEEADQEFINALLDIVITELEDWGKYEYVPPIISDHAVAEQPNEKLKEPLAPLLFFRTCIEIDRPKQRAIMSLRLKTSRKYPDNGLVFEVDGKNLSCRETIPVGWSTPLVDISSKTVFDPSTFDWLIDWTFTDAENRCNVTFKKSNLRVFLPGDEEGIPGYIESSKLNRDSDFYVVCHESQVRSVKEWGQKACKGFEQLAYSGIPRNWTLFKGAGATEPHPGVDVLGLSTLLRIHLEGGIGIGRTNQYLCFAPPKIKIDGGLGNEKVLLNGAEIEKSTANTWELPKDAPIGRSLNIGVTRDGELLPESRIIELAEPVINVASESSALRRNYKGDVVTEGTINDYVSCAFISSPKFKVLDSPQISPTSFSNKLIFIGQVSGQVSRWPLESVPSLWSPVWVLYKTSRVRWVTNFCRKYVDDELSPVNGKQYTIKDLRAWKEVLWIMRKRTRPPELPALAKLWIKYQEAAKNI